jgi:hypothetical protein
MLTSYRLRIKRLLAQQILSAKLDRLNRCSATCPERI